MDGIRKGEVDSIVVENTYVIGQRAEEAIAALHQGHSIERTVLVPSLLVTRDNIDRPEIQQILSADSRGAQ
jgi:ABC-type sugar transport system substrate-binding protein